MTQKTNQKSFVCVSQHLFLENIEISLSRIPYSFQSKPKVILLSFSTILFPLPQKPQHATIFFLSAYPLPCIIQKPSHY